MKDNSWYIPRNTPKVSQQKNIDKFASKLATKLTYSKKSLHNKDVGTENGWTFELGV